MVKSIKYYNIQSWEGEKDLELSPSQLTVLKAQSEVGKSTLVRFFIRFCTSNGDNEDYRDIIRDGCETGAVTLVNDDNTSVMFMMEAHSRAIGLLSKDGEIMESYFEQELTEKVFERFGLIVDQKNDILINVLSRDLPLLLINTSPIYNGAVMSRVLIDRDVERALDNLKIKEATLAETLKLNSYKREQSIEATQSIKRANVDNLKWILNQVEAIIPLSEQVDKFEKTVKEYKDELNNCKGIKEVGVSSNELNNLMSFITSEQKLTDLLVSIVNSAEEYLPVTSSELVSISLLADKVTELTKLVSSMPKETMCLPISSDTLQFLLNLESIFSGIGGLTTSLHDTTVLLESTSKKLDECKHELGVCPLCGEVFK